MSHLKSVRSIPKTVWAIGVVSLLINASAVAVFNILPLYVVNVLGASMMSLGILEGVAEMISWFLRLCSGILSDYLHRRKAILIGSYAMFLISRAIFPLANSIGLVFVGRYIDRLGNGLQATPREALVADVAPSHLKGTCFGLRQTLGLLGSFIGASALMYVLRATGLNYKLAFWLAAIPPFLAIIILVFFVKDKMAEKAANNERSVKKFKLQNILHLSPRFWRVVIIATLFMFSNYSGAFMILQVKNAGLSEYNLPVVMIIQNLFAFLLAFPVGWLSDTFGRRNFLIVGFSITILSNLFLATTTSLTFVLVGVGLWGVQMGINQSLLMTKVADTISEDLRSTGFGIYYMLSGVALFITNTVSGYLTSNFGSESVFYLSSVIAAISTGAVLWLPKSDQR